jgi:putative membrane protein
LIDVSSFHFPSRRKLSRDLLRRKRSWRQTIGGATALPNQQTRIVAGGFTPLPRSRARRDCLNMKTMNLFGKFRRLELLALAVSLVAAPAFVRGADTVENRGQLSKSDYKFASDAARGGLMEVRAGELARQRATDPGVKQFAERMVTDHSRANAELERSATQKGVVLPTDLESKQQRHLDHLQNLSGADFDKAYIKSMVSDHKEDSKEFDKAAQNVDDQDLKAFASRTAGVINQHLQQAKDLEASLEKK